MSNEAPEQTGAGDTQWESFTSAKGKSFEVGFSPSGDVSAAAVGGVEGKQDFGIAVSWPVATDGWVGTTSQVRNTAAITRYNLYAQDGSTYKYILYFTNTEHYNYYFYDETGDSYQVNTYRNGDHYVRYNSDKPDIVYIRGS